MSSPSKHRNMTTHESAKGLTNPLESDLHDPNSTNTMNGILGTIDKNTFERWFMTNDEPWTKQIKSRTLDDKSKELSVLFQNGSSFNLRMKDSIEFDIVCIRRQMEATSAEKSDEKKECDICLETMGTGIPQTRFSCQRCAYTTCGACQIKTVEQKGYLACPGCRNVMWGQSWFYGLYELYPDYLKGFRLKPNHVFIQHFHAERELAMWYRTRAHLIRFLKIDLQTPEKTLENDADILMGQHYELFKNLLIPPLGISNEQHNKNGILLAHTTDRTLQRFREPDPPQPKFRIPCPQQYVAQNEEDARALYRVVFGDWFTEVDIGGFD